MKAIHLLPLFLMSLNFSGMPIPAKPVPVKTTVLSLEAKAEVNDSDLVIPWNSTRKLVWEDFLSLPKKEGDAVASTSTSLGLSYQVREGQLTYRITCDFSKEKSWGSLKTEYILAHEQAHFDITEIHARKLYEALSNYEFNKTTFKSDIATIYNRIVREKEEMQEMYDGQTDHSRKKVRQIDWLERIDQMLTDTEVYSTYP